MKVRAILLASAVMTASGLWIGSAGAAPIRADMSLQNDAMFEQVQMHGGRGSGGPSGGGGAVSRGSGGPGGGGSAGMSRGAGPGPSGGAMSRAPSFSAGAAMNRSGGPGLNRSGGPGPSRGAVINRDGGNLTGDRVVRGGNWAENRDGRRHDWRGRHRHRGSSFAFGFSPGYDYGYYDYGYSPYYDDDYVAGVADGDAIAECQRRFRSYDLRTQTYLGLDGLRHPCP
jgi:hypothetical protein